jgi:hypothetical protein
MPGPDPPVAGRGGNAKGLTQLLQLGGKERESLQEGKLQLHACIRFLLKMVLKGRI